MGAGHAREQKEAGIGVFLVPERKVASMAALCPRVLLQQSVWRETVGMAHYFQEIFRWLLADN